MKQLVSDLTKSFATIRKEIEANRKEKEFNQSINGMMKITFSEKSSQESIKIFQAYCKKFETELAKRSLEALIESETAQEYFHKKVNA